MANPQLKPGYKNTLHRDGSVSYWDVFDQVWRRKQASDIPDDILSTFSHDEVDEIRDHKRSMTQ